MSLTLVHLSLCSRARGLEWQSHDWEHIARVRALAVSLAAEEGVTDPAAREVVELAALLHDVADWKYSGSETAGVEMARAFLGKQGYPSEKVRSALDIARSQRAGCTHHSAPSDHRCSLT